MVLGVSNVDRAKALYENLGWRLDIDITNGEFRVRMTPHNSGASIILGKGITWELATYVVEKGKPPNYAGEVSSR